MKILCSYNHTIFTKDNFVIAKFKAINPSILRLPDGDEVSSFIAKGINLPDTNIINYMLEGEWERYKKSYTFSVTKIEEILPTDKETTIEYLTTLKGVGKKTAKNMYDKFGNSIFEILEDDYEKLSEVPRISLKKAKAICEDFNLHKSAREIFQYLLPFHLKQSSILEIHKVFGMDSVKYIKKNPYCIADINGISFSICEKIRKSEKIPEDFQPRYQAALIEVLKQSENGGPLFNQKTVFPDFLYEDFLREELFNLILQNEIYTTGNTCTPQGIAYIMFLKLLKLPVSEKEFNQMAVNLHLNKKIFIYKRKDGIFFYRFPTAKAEFNTVKKLTDLMEYKLPEVKNIEKIIYDSEKSLGIKLSDEQENAIKMALTNSVSIITGGPGTGKTSVQRGIIKTFQSLFPEEEVLLMAPTGRAAKRMTETTSLPASTIHKAIKIVAADTETEVSVSQNFTFSEKLIIVDEASMVGSYLFNHLLFHIKKGTRLVIVGDVDQLPSIEVGAVLKELIQSNTIPVVKLTKTFRQANGSRIAINCSRIKSNENNLEEGDDFMFIKREGTENIASTVTQMMPQLITEYGEDNVVCLTPYKRSTETGSKALNEKLREKLRENLSEKKFFERQGTKFYEGDRIMFTKNTDELTNGDIGKIESIKFENRLAEVTCIFNEKEILLSQEDFPNIELAYARTVHKTQGDEYKCVLLVLDKAHKNLISKAIFYTAISRAKEKIYLVGYKEILQEAIENMDKDSERFSSLAYILNWEKENRKKKEEQLTFKFNEKTATA